MFNNDITEHGGIQMGIVPKSLISLWGWTDTPPGPGMGGGQLT